MQEQVTGTCMLGKKAC